MPSLDLSIEKTSLVTFYSFNGGVGRSMALVNVAGIMAGRGFRILALDMDLEAPGISYLMRQEAQLADKQLPGFVDLLTDSCTRGEEADLFALSPTEVVERYSYAYPLPSGIRLREDGLLRIMPAGQFDGDYQKRLDSLALGQLYREGQGKPLIEAFKQVITEAKMFDFVFIDSRTGFSDESGICTRDLADYLVVVMGLNRQNQEGTADFLRSLRVSQAVPKGLRVVLSPVPNGEDELVDEREKQAAKTLSEAFNEEIELGLQIPYHPRLALTEEPHIFRRSKGHLYESYAAIERAVLKMMELTPQALQKEVAKMAEAKRLDAVMQLLHHLERIDPGSEALASMSGGVLEKLAVLPEAAMLRSHLADKLGYNLWAMSSLASKLHDADSPDAALFYEQLIKVDPNDADTLGNYANFLTDVLKNHQSANLYYKSSLVLSPNNAINLGNYAYFLEGILKDHDAAEAHYKLALKADPQNPINLGNYAFFLTNIRKDHDGSEEYFKLALDTNPKSAANLGSYANFLTDIRKDHDSAEAYYKRALETAPDDVVSLGNYAKLLFISKRLPDAIRKLNEAFKLEPVVPDLKCELHFYACAHAWEQFPESLSVLKSLLVSSASSPDWPLEENVRVAQEEGHPHPEFIAVLADVVSGKAKVADLERFEVWQKGAF